MGSIESTVSEMDDTQEQSELSSINAVPQRNRRRRRRHTTGNTEMRSTNESLTNMDDPWWWEIENENLILDQVLVVPPTIENNENSNIDVSKFLNESEDPSRIDENPKNTCDKNIRTKDDQTDRFETNTNRSKIAVFEHEFCTSKREQSLDDFKKELRTKRLERQNAVQDLRNEIASLKQQLSDEKALTRKLKYNQDCKPTDNIVELPNGEEEACALSTPSVFDTDDEDPQSRGRHANIELANAQLALQLANSENISLRTELGVVQKQVCTLKEVIACCKQMLVVKEEQCSQLKSKLEDIEKSFADREMSMMSDNLRQEYERQLSNIRQLRQLYEERQRVAAAEYENLQRLISIKKDELLAEQEKTKNFEERNYSLIKEVELVNNELSALRDECNEHKFEKRALKDEMGAVNTLFSQMVMGFSGKNTLDIDRLTTMLEENRSLLSEIATKEMNISDGATLPKLLFELVEEAAVSCHDTHSLSNLQDRCEIIDLQSETMVDGESKIKTNPNMTSSNDNALELNFVKKETAACSVNDQINMSVEKQQDANINSKTSKTELKIDVEQGKSVTMLNLYEPEILGQVVSTQEIIINLPKVWKVLIELLSHHKTEQKKCFKNGDWDNCDKSIETRSDSKTELSVSKTYIKLKDLILEKKSLVKETNRLKTLNSHLEYRLNEQEKRLSAVSLELTKTWHLVGKMQRQHRQLHTQEQILRYQLQQKRRLLTELKDELEYCRRKWATARAKNEETQQQWNDLRREFAKRKLDDANNSAESGFSDSGPVSDEEERCDKGPPPEASGVVLVSSTSACSRRKHFKEMFEHTRKIKRMQSTSPGRAINSQTGIELVLRWNSAPPTCGWRRNNEKIGEREQNEDERAEGGKDEEELTDLPPRLLAESSNGGAISKRHRIVGKSKPKDGTENDEHSGPVKQSHHTDKIHKLEEQCKSLIKKVLETSDNRERLEIQLCRFQDEIAPVQYTVPLNEFINKKRLERMTRASSVPATGTLTPREEEYTRKRSERLERLEEESRQLLSRIKRTADRGNYLRSFLDSIRRGPSEPNHEDSYESNTEEEDGKIKASQEELNLVLLENNYGTKEVPCTSHKLVEEEPENLTAEEKAYTLRRTERLKRLERESKQLLESLTQNNQRSEFLANRLDSLHERYSSIENNEPEVTNIVEQCSDKAIHPVHNQDNTIIPTVSSVDNAGEGEAIIQQTVVPTPKNVASSSIVDDELRDIVTVTTVPSQIAQPHLGAIPKSKLKSQLCAGRTKSGMSVVEGPNLNNLQRDCVKKEADESLEEMVKRLKALPFPNEDVTNKNQEYSNTEEKNRNLK